tara:strand:- start:412 stop:621 length:210 start_codon:yes stop_codon:yes gene_type:complete
MIDIDKCMKMWKDNRAWYIETFNPPVGKRGRGIPSAEEELINTLYAEVKRLREVIAEMDDLREYDIHSL